MALILTYRSNRFVNFAYGAMGSLVGVLAIGMYQEHDVPYFVVLPLGVALGVLAGGLIEFAVLRRFRNASRLVLTVRQHRAGPTARWLRSHRVDGDQLHLVHGRVQGAARAVSIDLGVKTLGWRRDAHRASSRRSCCSA